MNQSSVPSCSSSSSSTGEPDFLTIEHGNDHSTLCKWKIRNFSSKLETRRQLLSGSFEVGGFNCNLLVVYPNGDFQSQPGYCSIYLQIITDSKDSKECFASYGLSVMNLVDESKSIRKESSNRYSEHKFLHGWCDFAHISTLVDPVSGFISNSNDDYVVIACDILVLKESAEFIGDHTLSKYLDGRFTWKVHNFSFFKEKLKTQKIVSPVFPATTECDLSITLYESNVNGIDYLSICLENKKENYQSDQSCWCLFRMSVKTQKPGLKKNMERDSYGRLAIDSRSGDNASLGWNDYMKMSDFIGPDLGFLVNDTAVFQASFQILQESSEFTKNGGSLGERSMGREKKSDGYIGKFTWRIYNFTRLRDLCRKKRLYDLSVKSKRFQIGDRDCRLIVYLYPRGSEPYHLSLFLEVTDSRNTASDSSCFVRYRLSVVNQHWEEKSIVKESQNRYSKVAKNLGWDEFMAFHSFFNQSDGFLVEDSVVFSAEVLILNETYEIQDFSEEFKLNPNAQNFTPLQTPLRSLSPVSDGSCYFPNNVSAVQLMQCLPMSVGYGQPVIMGHYPRQGLCMLGYIVWAADDYGSSSQASPVQNMNAFELQNPNVMELSYSLEGITVDNQPDEAIGDEHNKCVMQSFLIEDETPREDKSLPFVKCSLFWDFFFKSKDIFRAIPQRLHFHPLKQFNMELREGLAIDLTCSFVDIVEKTEKAKIDDPMCILQGMLNALEDLKAHGFNAKPIQVRLEKLLRIKEEQGQISSQLVEAEEQINKKLHEKVMLETELEEIGMEMRKMQECLNEMKKKWNSVEVKNENQGSEIAELKTTMNILKERFQCARLEFNSVVADPW